MGSSPVDWEEMVQAAWEDWVRKAYQSVYLGVSIEHHRGSQPPPCQGLHHKQSLWGPSKLCQQHHLSMVPGWGKAEVWEPGRRVGICESWRLAPHAACFLQEKSYNFHSTDEETKLSWPPVIQWISDRAKIRNHAFSVWMKVDGTELFDVYARSILGRDATVNKEKNTPSPPGSLTRRWEK